MEFRLDELLDLGRLVSHQQIFWLRQSGIAALFFTAGVLSMTIRADCETSSKRWLLAGSKCVPTVALLDSASMLLSLRKWKPKGALMVRTLSP